MTKLCKLLCAVFLIFLGLNESILAQTNNVSGMVRDAETGEHLPGANVFLDGTKIGTQTDSAGKFYLSNIPDGTFTLVISFVGYKKFIKQMDLSGRGEKQLQIMLEKDVLEMDELIVRADYPKEWQRNLRKFKKYFLGFTKNADKTEILNPEVLNFYSENGNFIAISKIPLKIENKALGYFINFHLEKFVLDGQRTKTKGYSEFSLMNPESREQENEWEEERSRAYRGSFRHFISALTSGSLNDEGFRIRFADDLEFYTEADLRLISNDWRKDIDYANRLYAYSKVGQIELTFHKAYSYLVVKYINELPEYGIARRAGFKEDYHQVSFIELPMGKAIIDTRSGSELAPYRAILHGYWGWTSRIPDLLPKDYGSGAADG